MLVLTHYDIISVINYLIKLVNGQAEVDDVDHLANRRVRSVGEQLAAQFVIGLARMGKNVRENSTPATPTKLRPVTSLTPGQCRAWCRAFSPPVSFHSSWIRPTRWPK